MQTDTKTLNDLALFARAEIASRDIEPWAEILRHCRQSGRLTTEEAAWAVKLYNAFDGFESAFRLFDLWRSPHAWLRRGSKAAVIGLPCGTERRNLRGGLVARHLDSYVAALAGQQQYQWLREAVPHGSSYGDGFDALMGYMRTACWGTGRLAAFEWAEFAGKCLGLPVAAGHGCLWESSGPRESLERIYNGGNPAQRQAQLDSWAEQCREYLARHEAPLDWVDLETVICDFNVMRKGRYYPGKHLAMVREEIDALEGVADYRDELLTAFHAVIPKPWCNVGPGVDKKLAAAYAADGIIRTPFGRA